MNRYIDAEKLIRDLKRWKGHIVNTYGERDEYAECIEQCIDTIENQSTADVEEVRHGRWTHDGSIWKYRFICSECGYKIFTEPQNYCPACGAKMDGGKE